MNKINKNFTVVPIKSIIRYGKLARRQREDYKLDRNSAALIKCEDCDKPITVDKEEYKKN